MTYNEVKAAVLSLSTEEQRRLIVEVVPQLWPKACIDDACVQSMRDLVDDATIKKYREEHMGHV